MPIPPPARRDIVLAAACCVLDLVLFSRVGPHNVDLPVLAYAISGSAALLWRARAPRTVFAVVWLHSVVAALALPADYRPMCGVLLALYTVSAVHRMRAGLAAAALCFVPIGLGLAAEFGTSQEHDSWSALLTAATMLSLFPLGAWALGWRVRAQHRKVRQLEYQREAAAREAAALERRRLARELHDIIAHCVSIMLLQAAGARRVLATDPERAARAMANIEKSGLRASGELRRLLGVLRADDASATEQGTAGGLAALESLLDQVRGAGIPVRWHVHGSPGPLDPSVDLSAYRIVQEALTNVARYAGRGARTDVELRWEAGELRVIVTDDGRGELDRSPPPALGGGNGLPGMRERAAAVGGHLQAGPLPGGGFRVTAVLPVAGAGVREGPEPAAAGIPAGLGAPDTGWRSR